MHERHYIFKYDGSHNCWLCHSQQLCHSKNLYSSGHICIILGNIPPPPTPPPQKVTILNNIILYKSSGPFYIIGQSGNI